MYTRKQALAYARQHRTCPPLNIRNNPAFKKEVARHISQCPFCSTGLFSDTDDWDLLAGKLKKDFGHLIKSKKAEQEIVPGQVRSIHSDMACWYKGYYYTPPDVFILDVGGGSENAVTVAQIYHDLTLAGPGDLIVGDRRKFPYEFFIEAWNIYTLTASRVGSLITNLPDKVVKAVQHMDKDPDYLPDWADCLTSFVDEDPRLYFRDLEIEVGYVLSAPAVNELITEMKTAAPVIKLADVASVKYDIGTLIPGIKWKVLPGTVPEALLTADYPDDYIQKAAASAPDLDLMVQVYRVKKKHVTAVKKVYAEVFQNEPGENAFEIGGRVRDLPADAGQADFLCCLVDKKSGTPLYPDDSRWEHETGHFFIRFAVPANFAFNNFALRLALLIKEP